jgi:hypothetical protein
VVVDHPLGDEGDGGSAAPSSIDSEYSGNLLQYLDRSASPTAPEQVYAALVEAVPAPLTVLDESQAQDKDSVVVSREPAQRLHLASIADLAPHCGEVTFGGSSSSGRARTVFLGCRRTTGARSGRIWRWMQGCGPAC